MARSINILVPICLWKYWKILNVLQLHSGSLLAWSPLPWKYWKILKITEITEKYWEKNTQTNWMFSNLTLVHHSHGPHLPRHQLRHQYPGHLEQNHVGRIHIVLDRNSLEEEIKFLSWRAISLHQGWNCRSPFHYDLPRCISPGQKKTFSRHSSYKCSTISNHV